MVEQWTENPCVPGSIPGGTTKPTQTSGFFVFELYDFSTIKTAFQTYIDSADLQSVPTNTTHNQFQNKSNKTTSNSFSKPA